MMMAVAGDAAICPACIVPGGVTLPPTEGEDAGKVQTIGARYVHGDITLHDAADRRLLGLRHARRRLPVPRHGGHVASRGRGPRHVAAAFGPGARADSRSGSNMATASAPGGEIACRSRPERRAIF